MLNSCPSGLAGSSAFNPSETPRAVARLLYLCKAKHKLNNKIMNLNKPTLTFEIKNSDEFFNKLLQEYEDFDNQHLNPRHAMNCAITTWHLTDWTYHEFFSQDKNFQTTIKKDKNGCEKRISGLKKYQTFSIKQCPELEYMRLIANGTKHCILRDKSIKEKTKISEGHYSTAYYRHDYNVPRFEIEISKVKSIDFEKIFLKTLKYWEGIIQKRK